MAHKTPKHCVIYEIFEISNVVMKKLKKEKNNSIDSLRHGKIHRSSSNGTGISKIQIAAISCYSFD